jgi:L-aminopeptidase/D-esterase-like protein
MPTPIDATVKIVSRRDVKNLITDVPGLRVGHAADPKLGSGVTAIVFDEPTVASVDLRGGGPGTRETDLLDPAATVERIDAIALSGGSAIGLEAGAGVMAFLAEQGRGFAIGSARVPIVPSAILFDLLGPGEKKWGRYPPYRELGYAAAQAAAGDFALGSAGAGTGATTQNLKGGIGSASAHAANGHLVGALVAVNAAGRTTIGAGPHFWAAPFESGREFGGLGLPSPVPADAHEPHLKGAARVNTTLCVVATDAVLTKAHAARLAVMAGAGLARAIAPVFSPLDGDIVFAGATGRKPLADPIRDLAAIGAAAAACVARAVARGIYEATALPFSGAMPSWRDRFKA